MRLQLVFTHMRVSANCLGKQMYYFRAPVAIDRAIALSRCATGARTLTQLL